MTHPWVQKQVIQVGDIVECIDGTPKLLSELEKYNLPNRLTVGTIIKNVRNRREDLFRFKELDKARKESFGGWFRYRFKLVGT
jgi:hypothetical protein